MALKKTSKKRMTAILSSFVAAAYFFQSAISAQAFWQANPTTSNSTDGEGRVRMPVNGKPMAQGYAYRPHSKDTAAADREAVDNGYKAPAEKFSPGTEDGMGMWYKRWVEIVPKGQKPQVNPSVTKYYVVDDGDFINPDTATPLRGIPTSTFGDGLPNAAYRFAARNDDNGTITGAPLEDLNSAYLPLTRSGYAIGQIQAFYLGGTDGDDYFWCIGPNAMRPDRINATDVSNAYIYQNPKYAFQTSFMAGTELSYLFGLLGENLGLVQEYGSRPDFVTAFDNVMEDYTTAVAGTKSAQPTKGDPNISYAELYEQLNKLIGFDGQTHTLAENSPFAEQIVPDEDITVADWDRAKYLRDPRSLDIASMGFSGDQRSNAIAYGLEIAALHYTQGIPASMLQYFQALNGGNVAGALFNGAITPKPDSENLIFKSYIRYFIAMTEAARAKGVLDTNRIAEDHEAKIDPVSRISVPTAPT